jgi:zinc protease
MSRFDPNFPLEEIAPEHLQFTKDALVKSNARSFETLGALIGILDNIATYNRPDDLPRCR